MRADRVEHCASDTRCEPAGPAPSPQMGQHFALAPAQRGLWFVQQLAPDCGAYHLVFSLQIDGVSLQRGALEQLLDKLMQDYPVLRTCITAGPATAAATAAAAGDESSAYTPHQYVNSNARAQVHWHGTPVPADDVLRERIRTDARIAFDLAAAPLWRVHVYATGPQSQVLAVVAHHIALDFWSLGLLLTEVAGRLGLMAPSETELDGSGFLTEAASTSPPQAALAYWEHALRGAPVVHSVPLDAPRAPLQTYSGRSRSFVLSAQTSNALRALAQQHGATPFMVLLAAYFVWLYRLSADTDIVVASPVAGRARRAQRTMLGQFVNTLPLRGHIDAAEPFVELLARVRTTVIEAMRHQECPYSTLVERLAPQRDPSYPPLAQLGFSWERLPLMAEFADFFLPDHAVTRVHDAKRTWNAEWGALSLAPFPVPQQEGQLELLMEMGGQIDGAYIGTLKYHDTLFEASTIDAWLHSWDRLLQGIVANPNASVGHLPMIDPLKPRPATHGPAMNLSFTHTLREIAAVAQARPTAVAVRDATTQLSYAQLLQRARCIGAQLTARGVRRGDHVGLMVERSVDLLAAILGIWSAGAAYVPLDPTFPRERLSDIAQDAQLAALVTQAQWEDLWPATSVRLLLDAPSASPASSTLTLAEDGEWARSGALPETEIAPGEVAYLIYTSGSTGKPKGVRIGHASVANFLQSMRAQRWCGRVLDEHTRWLAITTPAFDISVLELLLPLLVGGTVVVCARDVLTDGVKLARCLQTQDINMMQATPATWKMLLDADWPGISHMGALCGGEPLPRGLATALQARTAALWNMYGPTETTVWSTAVRIAGDEPIHLGPPIANTQLHVLDERQQPVPPGVLGELWIGGAGLALDYWQRPELTAERFCTLRNSTGDLTERLYRTGDRVRFSAQGRLEHHGRLDFQVKLRGFRIELGEIEAVLRSQPGVRDAVVIVREDQPQDPRLVAYVVTDPDQATPDIASLRTQLQTVLPAYMLPSAWVWMAALPQTPNKKIDRKALPAPQPVLRDRALAPARDALEIQLVALFERLLNVAPIGIEDNFFDLGGHSLLAVQLTSEIRRLFDTELPVADLLTHGSVAALAQRVREGTSGSAPPLVVTLQPGKAMAPDAPALRPLWLFHPIGGNVFCYVELVRQLDKRRSVRAVQAPGLDREGEAEVTVEAMARRYIDALREHQPEGPYLLGGWCFGGVIAFEIARQLREQGCVVEAVIAIDTRAPVPANVPSDGDDATLLSWFARDLAVPYGKVLTLEPERLRALPAESMFDAVLEAAHRIGVLPADADRAQLARYFEVYIANAMALQMYFPQPEEIPVLLVRAQDEPQSWGPALGWDGLVPTHLTQVDLPGDHNSIVYAPQVSAVAAQIDQLFSGEISGSVNRLSFPETPQGQPA